MRLITHATVQRDFTERGARREHESLSKLNAALPDPNASGHAKGPLEHATEVTNAHID